MSCQRLSHDLSLPETRGDRFEYFELNIFLQNNIFYSLVAIFLPHVNCPSLSDILTLRNA